VPYALAGWLPGGRRYCVLCEHKVWRFMPYRRGVRSVSPLMRALDVVGSAYFGERDRSFRLIVTGVC